MNKGQLFLILNYLISYLDAANSKGYGQITVKIDKIEVCRGPRRRDCCVPNITVKEGLKLTYDLLVKENFILTSGKVLATVQGKEVMKLQMKKPCDHFLIRTLFQIYLNVSDNCGIPKGHHVFTADVEDISQKYYGGKYFYGNFTVRSIFAGNDCNFFCTMMDVVMMPKKS